MLSYYLPIEYVYGIIASNENDIISKLSKQVKFVAIPLTKSRMYILAYYY